MCTDSFHGSVFSVLTGVPFVVQIRKDKAQNMNSRLETLLSKLKLSNRFMKDGMTPEEVFSVDYTEASQIIEEERKVTEAFLDKAFGR